MTYMMTRNANDYMDDLFSNMFCNTYPSVNISEDSKAYYLEAALPGYTNDDVNISVDKHVLHISSEKANKKDDRKYVIRERHNVKFDRSFSLPEGINETEIEAEFKNGILTVTLPKQPVVQPKKITVKVTA